jgi:hypothetical protein
MSGKRYPYFRVVSYLGGGADCVHVATGASLEVSSVEMSMDHAGLVRATFVLPPGSVEFIQLPNRKPQREAEDE